MDAIRSRVKHRYIVGACAVAVVVLGLLGGLLAHRGGEEAAVKAGVNRTSNGTCNRPQSRISGGRPAAKCEAPQYLGSFGTSSQHMCHADAITPRFVLATAVCLAKVESYGLKYTVDRLNLDDDSQGQTRKVVSVQYHPKWNPDDPKTWMYNQAVGKLDEDIEIDQYPCLAAAGSVIPAGTPGLVFGYGRTGTNAVLKPPRRMQVADVLVYDLEVCKSKYGRKVKDDMICVGNEAGGQNICKGDDGAPLMAEGLMLGMNIRGPKLCGSKKEPSLYQTPIESFVKDAVNQLSLYPQCGIRNLKTPDLKVLNGDVVQPHSWPWMVIREDKDGSLRWGGVLINETHVLTAWHRDNEYVVLGAHSLSSTTESRQRIKVEKAIWYPNAPTSYPWSPVLLKLSEPVKWTDNIRPICLPDPDFSLPAGTKCFLAGWGAAWGETTDQLRQVELKIIPIEECKAAWADKLPEADGLHNINDHNTVCTERTDNYYVSGWDEGGPLVCEKNGRWYNYATLSSAGYDKRPSMSYKNPFYVQWINPHPPANQVCFKKFEG